MFFLTEQYQTDIPLLKFALLLHDIGKPDRRTNPKPGKFIFMDMIKRERHFLELLPGGFAFLKRGAIYRPYHSPSHATASSFCGPSKGQLSAKGITRFFMACAPHIPHLFCMPLPMLKVKERLGRMSLIHLKICKETYGKLS